MDRSNIFPVNCRCLQMLKWEAREYHLNPKQKCVSVWNKTYTFPVCTNMTLQTVMGWMNCVITWVFSDACPCRPDTVVYSGNCRTWVPDVFFPRTSLYRGRTECLQPTWGTVWMLLGEVLSCYISQIKTLKPWKWDLWSLSLLFFHFFSPQGQNTSSKFSHTYKRVVICFSMWTAFVDHSVRFMFLIFRETIKVGISF